MATGVPVRWLVDQRELGLVVRAGKLPRSASDQRTYVRRLASAGVTALGFGVGLSFETVPDQVVDAADELDLPLLEVPLPTPFIAVTKAVADRHALLAWHRG